MMLPNGQMIKQRTVERILRCPAILNGSGFELSDVVLSAEPNFLEGPDLAAKPDGLFMTRKGKIYLMRYMVSDSENARNIAYAELQAAYDFYQSHFGISPVLLYVHDGYVTEVVKR